MDYIFGHDNSNEAKVRAAASLQRLHRGKRGRDDARLLRWERFHRAAFIIQNAYRMYRVKDSFRKAIHRRLHKRNKKNAKEISSQKLEESNTSSNGKNCVDNIFNLRASFEDKLTFWRKALELRRAHPQYPTDVIMKALITSKGDLQRGIILLGNVEFALRNMSDLSKKIRKTLLPIETEYEDEVFGGTSYNSKLLNSVTTLGSAPTKNSQVDVIRALKLRQEVQKREELLRLQQIQRGEYCEGGLDVSTVVLKCYFTKYFAGYDILARKPRYIEGKRRKENNMAGYITTLNSPCAEGKSFPINNNFIDSPFNHRQENIEDYVAGMRIGDSSQKIENPFNNATLLNSSYDFRSAST